MPSGVQPSRPGRGSKAATSASPSRISRVGAWGADGLALLGDEADPAGVVRRPLEPPPGPWSERPQREDGGETEGGEGAEAELDEQAAPAEVLPALLEAGGEGGDLRLVGGEHGPLLLDLLVGHEALGPDHGADTDAPEGEAEEDPLQLGLATEGVDDGEAQ